MEGLVPIEIDPKSFFRKNCSLPALPSALTKIQKGLNSDKVSTNDIVEVVKSDPSLVAHVLKIANSVYYSLPREVEDVRFAVAFLGLNEVYRIVLSISVVNTLQVKQKQALDEFWFHSYFTALITKMLAKRYDKLLSTEDLWSAAILHDIGKLIYLKFFPEHYKTLSSYCKDNGCLFSQAEKHFQLPASSYIGELLSVHWGLPNNIMNACKNHSMDDLDNLDNNKPISSLIRIICLGNMLAILSHNKLSENTKRQLIKTAMDSMKWTESDFLEIMGDVYELKIEVEKFNA